MRKFLPQISFISILLVAIGFLVLPGFVHAEAQDAAAKVAQAASGVIYGGLIGRVFWWVLIPLGSVVWNLLGTIVDLAVEFSLTSSFYSSPAIGLAWGVIRDIANMFFIFILIYEGIRTVLNLGNLVSVRKTITGVIIAALFLNFSLFFTKVVIDVSNVTATWFMQGIINIGGNSSLSASVGSSLGIQKAFSAPEVNPLSISAWTIEAFTKGILTFALICVAIYVFFNIIFLLIGRMVAFMFLLITAPIGFVGPLVPMLKEYSDKWWKELNDQAMMLPMFFLMVYLTLYIVDGVRDKILNAVGSDFGGANYVMFIIIIMMLLKALKVAEEYSGEIGKMVGGLAKNATTFVAGAGFAGTIGRAASALRGSDVVQNFAAKNQFTGRLALSGLNGVANAGLGAGSAYKGVLKTTGLDKTGLKDTFKSADKGYEGVKKDEIAAEQEKLKLVEGGKRKLARAQYLAKGGTGLMGYALKSVGATETAESLRKASGFVKAGDDAIKKDKDIATYEKSLIKEQEDKIEKEIEGLEAEKVAVGKAPVETAELENNKKTATEQAVKLGGRKETVEKEVSALEEKLKNSPGGLEVGQFRSQINTKREEAARLDTEIRAQKDLATKLETEIKAKEEATQTARRAQRDDLDAKIQQKKKELGAIGKKIDEKEATIRAASDSETLAKLKDEMKKDEAKPEKAESAPKEEKK